MAFFIDFDFLNDNVNKRFKIEKSSIGNTLEINHEHDIFEQISIFLLTFQGISPSVTNFLIISSYSESQNLQKKNYFFYLHFFGQKSTFF